MSTIEYRQAVEEDIPTMASIRAQEWGTPQYWNDRISGYLKSELHPHLALEPRIIYVAMNNHNLAGFIAGHLTTRYSCDGELEWINVRPNYQRQGVAAGLLRRLASWFSGHNARRVCVDVDPANAGARSFYVRFGAQELSKHWMVWDNINVVLDERKPTGHNRRQLDAGKKTQ